MNTVTGGPLHIIAGGRHIVQMSRNRAHHPPGDRSVENATPVFWIRVNQQRWMRILPRRNAGEVYERLVQDLSAPMSEFKLTEMVKAIVI